jgi:hypothetical protein
LRVVFDFIIRDGNFSQSPEVSSTQKHQLSEGCCVGSGFECSIAETDMSALYDTVAALDKGVADRRKARTPILFGILPGPLCAVVVPSPLNLIQSM